MQTKVVELDLNDVLPNRFQPRIKFSEESIQALSESIKEHGVIQPIVVRNIGDKYEIIAGERRYKASVLAGKQTIPAIITDLNEKDSAEVAIIENVQRKDLTPIEEAISYKKILDMGYLTQDSLALKLGKTQSTIANKLRLLNLDDDVQEALLNEKISERHARSLLKLDSHKKQRNLLQRIIEERLTVRKTDEEIDKMINNNENTEMLNFGMSTNPVDETNNKPAETFEFFNPNSESLNVPTEPIVENSIPEVLPTIESKPTTSFFNPEPVVINSTVPPVSLDMFKEVNEPVIESNPIFTGNSAVEEVKPVVAEIPINDVKPNTNDMNDIFTEKPLANMDNLLQSSSMPNASTNLVEPINVEEESNEDILVPGKFFNLLPEEDEGEKETTPANNEFSFDFDVNKLNNIESTNELPSLESFYTFGNSNVTNSNNINEKQPNTDSLFSFNTLENNNTSSNLTEPVMENTNNASDVASQLEIPIFESIPTLEGNSVEPAPANTTNVEPLFNFGSFQDNAITQNLTPSVSENTNNVMDATSQLEVPALEPISTSEPTIIPELDAANIDVPLVVPTESVENNNTKDIKNVIEMIREFSANLSKMGYVVDLDEFDFENMYQVVFKINK